MQAVILVGGEGTRLRPLTSRRPKPVITLVDRPFLVHMLEWLRGHGVDDVILSCGFEPTQVRDALGDGSAFGLSLRYVVEPDPRGTAGALKFAEDLLEDRFLMLNGDVLTDADVTAQIAQHEQTGATGTLGLVPVEDPSAYGLVLLGDDGAVTGFLEKPGPEQLEGVDEYLISAGIYVLERSVLERIEPGRNVSIEREIWPALVGHGLYGFAARDAYWMDIGTPERYLQGTADILSGAVRTNVALPDGQVLVADTASVAPGARVVGPSVLGPGVVVEDGAVVERSVVLDGARVGARTRVSDAIVAPGAQLAEDVVVERLAMVGDDAVVGRDNLLSNGVKLYPGAVLSDGAVRF